MCAPVPGCEAPGACAISPGLSSALAPALRCTSWPACQDRQTDAEEQRRRRCDQRCKGRRQHEALAVEDQQRRPGNADRHEADCRHGDRAPVFGAGAEEQAEAEADER